MCLPHINKDGIKELLYNYLGCETLEWSKKLGATSFEILFYVLQKQFETGLSCIVEAAFLPKFHTKRFIEITKQHQLEVIQVFCSASDNTSLKRFKERVLSGERHPSHVDNLVTDEEFKGALNNGKYGKLEIGGSCFELNTTDFPTVNYENLFNSIQSLINTGD